MFSLIRSPITRKLNNLFIQQLSTKTLIISNFNKSLTPKDIEGYCQSLLNYEDLSVFLNTNKFRLTLNSDDVNGAFHLLSNSKQLGDNVVVRIDHTRDDRPKYKSLYVSNLPSYIEVGQLKDFFTSEVTVLGCRIRKREGSPTCIAFVDVIDEDLTKALFKFNLTKIDGREISVSLYQAKDQAKLEGETPVTIFLTNIPIETTLTALFDAINPKLPLLALRFPKTQHNHINTYTDAFCEIYKKDLQKGIEILNKLVIDGNLLRANIARSQTIGKGLK